MPLYAKKQGESNIPPIAPGTYQAVCYGIVDVGTQHNDFFDNDSHKIIILWEIPKLRIGDKNVPRSISKHYTLSLGEKANLFKDLLSWLGQEPEDDFDVTQLIGMNCLLTITNETSKKGKVIAKISSVAKLMDEMPVKESESNRFAYIIEDNGLDNIPEHLPAWIKDEIKKSKEYLNINNPDTGVADVNENPPPTDDDLPF